MVIRVFFRSKRDLLGGASRRDRFRYQNMRRIVRMWRETGSTIIRLTIFWNETELLRDEILLGTLYPWR